MSCYFCTYFDKHYLPKGLALHQSLVSKCRSFHLWILCLDQECFTILQQLQLTNSSLLSMDALEKKYPTLAAAKPTRSLLEYYFTCTPFLPLYILQEHPGIELITYLDSDLWFFDDPLPIVQELGSRSVGIFEHRFSPHLCHMLRCGKYNVGWLSFRRDRHALNCLNWWAEQCVAWCFDRLEENRYGDQKYLDEWPRLFDNIAVFTHKGGNVAPWNIMNYEIRRKHGKVWIDDEPLIFFHFHGVHRIGWGVYETNLSRYCVRTNSVIRREIYGTYLDALAREVLRLQRLGKAGWYSGSLRNLQRRCDTTLFVQWLGNLWGLTQGQGMYDYMVRLREWLPPALSYLPVHRPC